MNWFRRYPRAYQDAKPKPMPPPAQPQHERQPFPAVMALADWHRSPALVASARELFATALWRRMLGVLYNGLPLEYLRRPGATPTDVARALGRIEGYVDAMNLLQSLGMEHAQSEAIPATWGAASEEAANG